MIDTTATRLLVLAAAPRECLAVAVGVRTALARATPTRDSARPPHWPHESPADPPPGWPLWQPVPLGGGIALVRTGVGKVNAGAAAVHALALAPAAEVALNVGICGSLPKASALSDTSLPLGSRVLADHSTYADEGLATPTEFRTCASLGFPLGDFAGNAVPGDPWLVGELGPVADRVGVIATVSTCSGRDDLAKAVAERTNAIAEAMEGAAIGHVLSNMRTVTGRHVRFAEVRVVSNTTGDRDRQVWDLAGSWKVVENLSASIAAWWLSAGARTSR